MSLFTVRTRGLDLTRKSAFLLQKRWPRVPHFSASLQAKGERHNSAMFKKAVQDHPGPTKPIHPNSSRLNANASAASKITSSVTGAKRKFDMASAGQSALGTLHSAVWFDENDFDDDDDLDFETPNPLPQSRNTIPNVPEFPRLPSTSASSSLSTPSLTSKSTLIDDIKYPELPPMDNISQEVAPSSSIPIPWSSSPPSHHLPPPKRRTIPWASAESNASRMKPMTPAPTKTAMPWNKTASAVKEEQRELRRLNKKKQPVDARLKKNPTERVASLFLSDEQRGVLEAVVDRGKSIFFTGSAGTGKSVLMREIIKKLRDKYRREPDRIAVTASTGLAACNIEGVTLHSFAGIGLGKEPAMELVKKVKLTMYPVVLLF